jgi:hypothetical protein
MTMNFELLIRLAMKEDDLYKRLEMFEDMYKKVEPGSKAYMKFLIKKCQDRIEEQNQLPF